MNLVTANPAGDWREESWTAAGSVPDFLAEFAGAGDASVPLIGAARETRRYAFYAREPITRWVADRVALLGDAAHPMLPFFAQGAGQAIEDGAVLAGCLRGVSAAEVPAALRRYESLRVERATRVQRMSVSAVAAPPHARRFRGSASATRRSARGPARPQRVAVWARRRGGFVAVSAHIRHEFV